MKKNHSTLSQLSPGFLRVCSKSPLKTLWEKDKSLMTSNLSISDSFFYPFIITVCHFHQI